MSGITELVDLDISRLDGVDRPANGTAFLIMKALDDGDADVDVYPADRSNSEQMVDEAEAVVPGGMDFPDAAGIFKMALAGLEALAPHLSGITPEQKNQLSNLLKIEGLTDYEENPMTPEMIEKMIDDKVAEALAKETVAVVEEEAVEKAEEVVVVEAEEVVKSEAIVEAPALTLDDLVKALEPMIAKSDSSAELQKLTARLETVEKMAAPPRAIAGPVAPGSGLSDIQSAFAKAAAATDPIEKDLLSAEATRLALASAFRQ